MLTQQQPCLLKYLVRGVAADRSSQQALTAELAEMLNHVSAITVQPVVDGFSVELEFDDIKPFTKVSFEPYIAEHVLADAANLRCSHQGALQIQLLKSRF